MEQILSRRIKICEKCGAEYTQPINLSLKDWNERKYCSRNCANKSKVIWGSLTKICKRCGKEFTKRYGYSQTQWDKAEYCSLNCAKNGSKWTQESKDKISGRNSPNFGKHPSIETRLKKSKHRGENAGNWQGGKTAQSFLIRHNINYKLWREAVFARDNWTCQKSGTRGGLLRAHHIFSFSKYPELRFAIDNGITLSDDNHKEFHIQYGKKNNTKEQIEEFIFN